MGKINIAACAVVLLLPTILSAAQVSIAPIEVFPQSPRAATKQTSAPIDLSSWTQYGVLPKITDAGNITIIIEVSDDQIQWRRAVKCVFTGDKEPQGKASTACFHVPVGKILKFGRITFDSDKAATFGISVSGAKE